MMNNDERAKARANMSSQEARVNPDCPLCGGCGEVWKYFKDEEEKIIDQVYDFCPACWPELADPILPSPGQVEIEYEEFNALCSTPGWGLA